MVTSVLTCSSFFRDFYLIHQECMMPAMKVFSEIEDKASFWMTVGRNGSRNFMASATAGLGASLMFIFIERPYNNARSLIKSKHVTKKEEIQEVRGTEEC
mmetsp:Transcript_46454/g.54281  ORF Transcript_46454/g.54281 Transcript_46454/m.54281 type:complete len:100 (-) Transcript_46454:111-410(-)